MTKEKLHFHKSKKTCGPLFELCRIAWKRASLAVVTIHFCLILEEKWCQWY